MEVLYTYVQSLLHVKVLVNPTKPTMYVRTYDLSSGSSCCKCLIFRVLVVFIFLYIIPSSAAT